MCISPPDPATSQVEVILTLLLHVSAAPEEMYWVSHLDKEDLCEKYVGLRDDFHTLKKFSCKQEDKIKK